MRALVGATARVRSSARLEELSLAVFDRTFKVTEVLRVLAGIVAFLGILSALLAIELERARELSVLRTLGFTPGGLGATLLTQTGLLGLAAGLAAMPIGTALALLLVHVINRRSFGWTMDFVLTPQALAVGRVAGRRRGVARRDLSGLAREPHRARRGAAGGLMRRALRLIALLALLAACSDVRREERRRAAAARACGCSAARPATASRAQRSRAISCFRPITAAHPEYRTEWWYFTGNLATTSGRHFGFELTFFRYALAPRDRRGARAHRPGEPSRCGWRTSRSRTTARRAVHRARAADARGARARRRRRRAAAGLGQGLVATGERRGRRADAATRGARRRDRARARTSTSTVPHVAHGDRGLDAKGAGVGNASHYYSVPRLAADGQLTVEGETFAVDGSRLARSRMEHELARSRHGRAGTGSRCICPTAAA